MVDTKTQRAPPPDLRGQCAKRPPAFPETEDAIGKLPPILREPLEAWAEVMRANADRLDRWVNWDQPGACP